jgi:hypothetical protein
MGATTSRNLLDNFTGLEKEIDKQSGLLKFLKQYSQYTCLKDIIKDNISMNESASQEIAVSINYKYLDNIVNIENIQFPCIIREVSNLIERTVDWDEIETNKGIVVELFK